MKKLVSVLLALILVVGLFAGCSQGEKAPENKPEENEETVAGQPIYIGVSCPQTGGVAAGGLRMQQAIEMAVDEINAAGGVLDGSPLKIILVDDQSNPTGSVNAVNKILSSEDITAMLGPHQSPMIAACNDILLEAEVPFITGATSPALLEEENPFFFRISCSDGTVAQVMVKYVADEYQAEKIGILYDNNDYGTAALNAIQAYADENGYEVYAEGFNTGDKDFTGQYMKIKDFGPDAIFNIAHDAETAIAIRQLHELGMGDIPFIASNALAMPQTYNLVDADQLEGMFSSTDYTGLQDEPLQVKFAEEFAQRYDGAESERYAALYYSATYLLADAIDRAGSADPLAVRDALKETQDFESVIGNLTTNEFGELNQTAYIVTFDNDRNISVAQQVTMN